MLSLQAKVVGTQATVVKLERLGSEIHRRVRAAVRAGAIDVQREVKAKLSGSVLDVQTGRLRRSVTIRAEDSAAVIKSLVGTNVDYAKVHELGFDGMVPVKAHARTRDQVFGRKVEPFVQHVKGHARHMQIPARPFLRPSLDEKAKAIHDRIAAAVNEATHAKP
jgi:phage gpG-like protein